MPVGKAHRVKCVFHKKSLSQWEMRKERCQLRERKERSQRAVPKYPRTGTIQKEKASINSQEQTRKKQENDLSDQQRVNKFHYGPSEG